MARRGEISPYKPVRTKSSYVCYAFPPFCLISSCLAKVREERAQIVLVTPIWQAQAWYPLLLQMSIEDPVLIPNELQHSPVSIERDTPPNSKPNVEISRVEGLRRSFITIGISEEAKELLLGSWKSGTRSAYDSAWHKWSGWCHTREIDPFSTSVAAVLDFLAWMYKEGYQYRTLNVHRSAISSVLPHFDGVPVGQLPIVKQLMKGVLQKNPPLPKYQLSWDLDLVLKYLESAN